MLFFRLTYIRILALLLLGFLSATASLVTAAETSPAPQAETAPYTYKMTMTGAPSDAIQEVMEQSSRLKQLEDKPPASLAALKRRAEEDVDGFNKVLRSEGYYGSKVTFTLDDAKRPVDIAYSIEPGPLFRITKFDVHFKKGKDIPAAPKLSDLGIEIGMPARSEAVVNAQTQIIVNLANRGFPNAKLADQDAIVDFATDAMEVTLTIDAGPRLYMGELRFEGLQEVEEPYLNRIADWKPGVLYDARTIDDLRRRYLRTGLFDTVRLKARDPADTGNTVPITLVFVERDRRSVGIGAGYSTSEGVGTQYYWENRNLRGRGEKLRADLTIAEIRRELKVTYVKPNFVRLDQNFSTNFDIKHENTDAYKENSVSTYAGVDRKWQENWVISGGLSAEYAEIDDNGKTDNFALLGVPLTARYNSTNDLLDPTTGYRFGTSIVPYVGLNQVSPDFLRVEMDGSTYYAVLDKDRLVLAARGKIGMMAGESTDNIPASKRFYSGGGGSVRGYKYQTVGPLDANNDPVGGRSQIEVGFEARTRVSDSIGIVPFIEGGNVFESMAPDFSGEFLWGAGLGFRYYTAIGPIRFDVAVPLNPRDGIDDPYQFYISIGQAF